MSDYVYYLGSAKQAADYETTTEYLIKHIRKTFSFGNDIATALEELQSYNTVQHKPILQFSKTQVTVMAEVEDEQFKIEFKAEFNGYIKRKTKFGIKYNKSVCIYLGAMYKRNANQDRVECRFQHKKGDPIELL